MYSLRLNTKITGQMPEPGKCTCPDQKTANKQQKPDENNRKTNLLMCHTTIMPQFHNIENLYAGCTEGMREDVGLGDTIASHAILG